MELAKAKTIINKATRTLIVSLILLNIYLFIPFFVDLPHHSLLMVAGLNLTIIGLIVILKGGVYLRDKTDVMLLIQAEEEAKLKEAEKLTRQGYIEYLFNEVESLRLLSENIIISQNVDDINKMSFQFIHLKMRQQIRFLSEKELFHDVTFLEKEKPDYKKLIENEERLNKLKITFGNSTDDKITLYCSRASNILRALLLVDLLDNRIVVHRANKLDGEVVRIKMEDLSKDDIESNNFNYISFKNASNEEITLLN